MPSAARCAAMVLVPAAREFQHRPCRVEHHRGGRFGEALQNALGPVQPPVCLGELPAPQGRAAERDAGGRGARCGLLPTVRSRQLDRVPGPLLPYRPGADEAQERRVGERLELQDWPADSPALLQPLFEVSFGCLEFTRPHLGGPEFDQRRCPKTFVANPRPDRTWTVGQLEQSPRLFGDSVQIVAGPREPQPHEHERKLEAPPAFFGHRGRLALRQRQIPLSLLQ